MDQLMDSKIDCQLLRLKDRCGRLSGKVEEKRSLSVFITLQ
jgi:hypothetical protein